jgi:GTPase Era involved in 16S rRNA processing
LKGKSAFGNSICGSQERNFPFPSGISSSSVTQIPKIAYREYDDRKLRVIDTPGLFDTNKSNDETMKQLTIAFQLADPGPHAFLIILSGRCTDEEINVLNLLKKKFGEYFLDYCFIIVTREDEIRDNDIQSSDDQIIQKYFQKAPQILQEFKIKCNHRCLLINNRASFEERERKIAIIVQMIKHNEDQHPNTFFNQEMFDQAERYDREWNNNHFDRQQKEIQEEVRIFN